MLGMDLGIQEGHYRMQPPPRPCSPFSSPSVCTALGFHRWEPTSVLQHGHTHTHTQPHRGFLKALLAFPAPRCPSLPHLSLTLSIARISPNKGGMLASLPLSSAPAQPVCLIITLGRPYPPQEPSPWLRLPADTSSLLERISSFLSLAS